MDREFLIRRLPEIAFAVLFGTRVWCWAAARRWPGIPRIPGSRVPGMAAQAAAAGRDGAWRCALAVPQGFREPLYPAGPVSGDTVAHAGLAEPGDAWRCAAVGAAGVAAGARPVIAICIDDLGEDLAGTDKAMALPQDVALSFLPYAETTPFLAEAAARKGHLVLAHVPMQALGRRIQAPWP